MGSWSVYCGISKIAITAGDKCVLLPIRKNKYQSYFYWTWQPATLPIFGTYNDYGGLADIEQDDNTKLIESHFGVPIDKFVGWFTEEITYDRGEVSQDEITNFEEMQNWNFMFISREVYDFLSTDAPEKGELEYGNQHILELLGFIKSDEDTGDARYKYKWLYDGKEFKSDGRWLHTMDNRGIYSFKGRYNSLCNEVNIPEDKMWIGQKCMSQLWECLDDRKIKELFMPLVTGSHYDGFGTRLLQNLVKKLDLGDDFLEKHDIKVDYKPYNMIAGYEDSIRTYANALSKLKVLGGNLHAMSSTFEPFVLYLTPQCGEHRRHHELLNKFTEIVKSKIYIDEDDED